MSEEHPYALKTRSIDRVSGSLVNVILGALILWVGQTTFQHAGLLSGFDVRLEGIGKRLEETSANTHSRFTQEHGEKISQRIDGTNKELTKIYLRLQALELLDGNAEKMATLRAEVERLKIAIAQRPYQTPASYSNDLRTGERPLHLPPTARR